MNQWSQINIPLLLAIVVAMDAVGLDEIIYYLNWNSPDGYLKIKKFKRGVIEMLPNVLFLNVSFSETLTL